MIIGAFAFALKNSIPHLRPIAERVHQLQSRLARMEQALSTTRSHRYTSEQILGASAAMREVGRLNAPGRGRALPGAAAGRNRAPARR